MVRFLIDHYPIPFSEKDDIEDQMGRKLLKNAKNWKNR
jgi:hypothetical protein